MWVTQKTAAKSGGSRLSLHLTRTPEPVYQHGMQRFGILLVLAAGLFLPELAHAQYKNSAFALDLGYEFVTRPSLTDNNGVPVTADHLPLRLGHSIRVGGEIDFKLHADHWWFTGRLNGKFFGYDPSGDPNSLEYQFDSAANDQVGLVFGLEGVLGVRYYFLTDRVRPYLGIGVSYMHLFNFTSATSNVCSLATVCLNNGGTVGDNFFAHSNIFSPHVQPGVEFIVVRDFAISLQADLQRWLIINAEGNWVFGAVVGMVFYG